MFLLFIASLPHVNHTINSVIQRKRGRKTRLVSPFVSHIPLTAFLRPRERERNGTAANLSPFDDGYGVKWFLG